MKKALSLVLLLVVVASLLHESDAWRRRRRRRWYPCNFNGWSSWSWNCGASCRVGTMYRYRYGYRGYPYCWYTGWQRQSRYCYSKGCSQYCSGGRCSCRSGYSLASNRRTCNDIDECRPNGGRGPCQSRCHNTGGSYYCSCPSGYYVCSRTRCCPVNCGRPKTPTSCPSSTYYDSQSIPVCKALPTQSHCSTVYPNRCDLRCPTYYSIATYSTSSQFMRYWANIFVVGTSYSTRCQANARWASDTYLSRLYCRRNNDPPERLTLSSTSINEHSPIGTTVGYLSTYDPNVHDTHIFTIRPSSAAIFFNIIGNRLVNTFIPRFNHHQGVTGDGNSFTIKLRVTDRGTPTMWKEQSVTVKILDANEPPENVRLSNYNIKEDAGVNDIIGTLSAYDPDLPASTNPCTWAITGFNSGFFKVTSNQLKVAKSLNFEAQNNHPVQISCTDFGRPAATTTETFVIDVQDVNEPPITLTLSNTNVDENAKSGFVIGTLTGVDQDKENLRIEMVGGLVPILVAGSKASTRFAVTSTKCAVIPQKDQVKARSLCTADLIVQPKVASAAIGSPGALDFETASWFQVTFFARDATHPSVHKSLQVNITINNVNEAPTSISIANQSIPETAPGGSLVSSLIVSDPDNSQRIVQRPACTLGSGSDNAYFAITGESPNMNLELAQTTMLDYESQPSYTISVTCNDHGLPPMTITRSFKIMVQDENEAPQNITLSHDRVKENAPSGTVIGDFATIDPDTGDTFSYHFAPGFSTNAPLAVNAAGQLVTTGKLDYESNDTYIIDVASVDQGHLEVIQTFLVYVEDVPEAPTDLTLDGNHTVPENSTVGTLIGYLIVTDQDYNQDPSCKVSGGADMMNFATGGDNGLSLVTTAAAMSLDFDSATAAANTLKVEVTCTDLDTLSITKTFTVMVTDVNEPPTDITLTPNSVLENAAGGTLIGTLSVTDPDAGQSHNCSVVDTQPQAGHVSPLTQFEVRSLKLYTKVPLDYELQYAYSVEIECTDNPTDGQPSIAYDKPIWVNITDVNEMPGSPCEIFEIAENKPDSTLIATLNASDPDNEESGKQMLSYAITNTVPFAITPVTNDLIKNGPLDYEQKKTYTVMIKVTDDGNIHATPSTFKTATPLSKTYSCTVQVLDGNDPHVPTSIRLVPANASVDEHAAIGSVIAVAVTDDVDAQAKHTYRISETDVPFVMSGANVTVTGLGLLVNYEQDSSDIPITIISTDEHNHSASRVFDIKIKNINERPQDMCLQGSSVQENKPAGFNIGQVVVVDPDYPPRTCLPSIQARLDLPIDYMCTIIDSTAGQIYAKRFSITDTLALVTKMPLDYETYKFYDVPISCHDKNQPLNIISNTFTINVNNVNEAPVNLTVDASASDNMFYNMTATSTVNVYIPEHRLDMNVLTFSVVDPDSLKHAIVTYFVSGLNVAGTFEMRQNKLYLLKALDHEGGKTYRLTVTAQDAGSLSTSITVAVTILDRADKPTQVHLECNGGALFDLASSASRTRRATTNTTTMAPLPTLPASILHNSTWGSSEDCSVITDSMVQTGYLIGKIWARDQDTHKWYNFTLSGAMSGMFELAPYGMYQGQQWQAAWLRLSASAGATAQSRFQFTQGSKEYPLRIDVVDQWGMHEIGQYLTVKTRDACYLGQAFCAPVANCTLDATKSSGYVCKCPLHYSGDGLSASTGCVQCSPGQTMVGGKCQTVNECDSSPCSNGATCTDGIYKFTCTCPAAYTGERCETHLKTCALQEGICLNGGTCMDTKDDILCQCPTGYEGFSCQIQSAACASYPSFCEKKDTTGFCAATPAIDGQSSVGICVDSDHTTHAVLTSDCVPSTDSAIDSTFVHRATNYIEEALNSAKDELFCLYHTPGSQSGSGISVSGRKKRAAPVESKQYTVQIMQNVVLKKSQVMHTVVVLDSMDSFNAVKSTEICAMFQSHTYLRCLGWSDCQNSTALKSAGFKCGQGAYPASQIDVLDPSMYIELYKPDPSATEPPCKGECDNIIDAGGSEAQSSKQHVPADSKPFPQTTAGIVVIVAACVALVAIAVTVVKCRRDTGKLRGRHDERLLHSNFDGDSTAGSQVSLDGSNWKQRFVDSRDGKTGVTNPMYEATGGGNVQESAGVLECENALYESPDLVREMAADMDN